MSDEVVYHNAPKTEEFVDAPTTVKAEPETIEQSDRGLFDYFGKKKEEDKKCEETAISSEFEEKVQVSEPEPEHKPEEKKESLLEKLHRSDSSSSSSDEEECDENGEKKKRKKPLSKKLMDQIHDHQELKAEEKLKKQEEDTHVPIEKYEVPHELHHGPTPTETPTPVEPEEKKGFMEKIKEKLPGHKKAAEEEHVAPPPPAPVVVAAHEEEGKEKKGIFEKIKEKIPGYHSKSEEEKEKEKVKECD